MNYTRVRVLLAACGVSLCAAGGIVPAVAQTPPPPAPPAPPGSVAWDPVGRQVFGQPTVFRGTAAGVPVTWMNPKLLRPMLFAGTQDPPGGGPAGGEIPAASQPYVAAAFNAGFKLSDIQGGWVGEGRTYREPVAGEASFVVFDDGTATVGQWGRDVNPGPNVVAVRQNLTLLVDGGQSLAGGSTWGAALNNNLSTMRSAVGVDASGGLIYAGAPVTPDGLANALVTAGAVRAMELDINPQWVSFNVYDSAPDGSPQGTKLIGTGERPNGRYLVPDGRDFVALFVRASVNTAATGSVALAPLAGFLKLPTLK